MAGLDSTRPDPAQPDVGPLVTVTLVTVTLVTVTLVTVTLEDAGEQTRVTMLVEPPDDVPAEVCIGGWNETIDRLVDAVAE